MMEPCVNRRSVFFQRGWKWRMSFSSDAGLNSDPYWSWVPGVNLLSVVVKSKSCDLIRALLCVAASSVKEKLNGVGSNG